MRAVPAADATSTVTAGSAAEVVRDLAADSPSVDGQAGLEATCLVALPAVGPAPDESVPVGLTGAVDAPARSGWPTPST